MAIEMPLKRKAKPESLLAHGHQPTSTRLLCTGWRRPLNGFLDRLPYTLTRVFFMLAPDATSS